MTTELKVYRHSYQGKQKGFTLSVEGGAGGYRIHGMKFGAANHVLLASFPLDQEAVDAINKAWAQRSRGGA